MNRAGSLPRIVARLAQGPRYVSQLAREIGLSRPLVQVHLRKLEGAGLVQHRSHGTRNLYALAPEGLVDLQQWLVGTWDQVLGSFTAYVENAAGNTLEQP